MAQKGDVSMADTLRKVIADLALAQTAQDADPEFLTKLQMVITARLRAGAQQQGPPPSAGPGSVAGPQPGMTPPGVAGPAVGPSSVMPGTPTSPDEIRRMLSGGRGVQAPVGVQ